jgi:hypothetical protein
MRTKYLLLALPLAALAAVAASGSAEAANKRSQVVVASGCPEVGPLPFCLSLKSGKQTYNISAANPRPPFDAYIIVEGTVSDAMSPCQGIPLANIKVTVTKRLCR